MAKVLISGYYGFANTGDEAILTVLLAELRARVPELDVSVVSGTPEQTARAHNVQAILWSDPLAITEAVRQADLVIVGGGGLFHDYTGFIPDGLLTDGNWGLGFHVTPALLAALYGKPLMLCAVGVGPLFSAHGKKFTKAACEAARIVTVRDDESRDILLSLGVAAEKVIVTADPAFGLRASQSPEIAWPGGEPRIGVVARHWAFGVHPVYWEGELAAGLDLFLERHGGSVVFLPFQRFPGEMENDVQVATRVRSRMKRQYQAMVFGEDCAPAEMAALVAACDLIVGMRLHAVIFSILGAVPFVALRYDPKVSQAVRLAGCERFEIDLGALDAPLLATRMEEALAARGEIQPLLRRTAGPLSELAHRNVELALEVLDRKGAAALSDDVIGLLRIATLTQLRTGGARRQELEQANRMASAAQSQADALRAAVAQLHEDVRVRAERIAQLEKHERELECRLLDETARLQLESAALRRELERAIEGMDAFQKEWANALGTYRNQRAWRVMLFFRKGYATLKRRGVLAFLGWLPRALAGRGGLDSEELEFPVVTTYVPKDLRRR
jgi:polysaccharide pyruvyl transferase CsaB